MEPKHPNQDLFRIVLYDYLKNNGFSDTAEIFRKEAQITRQTPPEFNHESYAFVNNFWNLFHDNHTSLDSQDPNDGAVMNTTPQILQEKYSLQHLSSFQSGQTLLSCDFSSDGNIVASGGLGNKPFICYMETGLCCGYSATTLESHLSTILEVRFQPGSNKFATCSTDKTVKLWDANTPEKPLFGFVGHNKVISLDFDPSGGILCSSDTSDELKVWDVNRQAMIRSLTAGGGLVRFQPGSGKFLAVAKQNVITIIEWSAFRVFNKLQGHVKDINSICWDVTGNMIASTSEDDIRVWSVFDGGQCIHEYPSDGKRFQSVIFHPRYHSVLVIGGYQCMELWILEHGGQRHSLRASEVSITGLAATMAQSGSIASASNDSVVKIWK
ncbi:hypothetical protein P8452_32916 [Trifolium repens]|nr:hypothetical protein P8452_32916 [Trifolium repens]